MAEPLLKSPSVWNEDEIHSHITNAVKEDLNLDYKACASLQKTDGKKAEISKDVSAFANAAGGTIIYGVKEDGHYPTEIDVGFDPDDISKEWLENIINSTIKPRIGGVIINQVELSTESPGRVLYVVDIPQTTVGGPHQAQDKKYYKRFNFKSEPMEDYEIRDVMRRALGPDLYCTLQLGELNRQAQHVEHQTFDLTVGVGNHSSEPALYAHFDLYLEDRLDARGAFWFRSTRDNISCEVGQYERDMNLLTMDWVTPHQPPIWKGLEQEVDRLQMSRRLITRNFFAVMVISAPHMIPKAQVFQLVPEANDPRRRVLPLDDVEFKEFEG